MPARPADPSAALAVLRPGSRHLGCWSSIPESDSAAFAHAWFRSGESGTTLCAAGLCFPPGTAAGIWKSSAPGSKGLAAAGEEKGKV